MVSSTLATEIDDFILKLKRRCAALLPRFSLTIVLGLRQTAGFPAETLQAGANPPSYPEDHGGGR